MARNEEISVYGIPSVNKPRYNKHYTVRRKTSGNVGDIIPIYCNLLVQPGDTWNMAVRSFFRLTTSLFPSMDNLQADIFAFAEDWQNVWDHTKDFWGEDEATPFDELPEYTIPQVVLKPEDTMEHDDILHHLAIPQMKANKGTVSTETRNLNILCERMSLNAYYDIYNRYFRDQNYIAPIKFSKGDEDINYEDIPERKLLKAARYVDYFAGSPDAQKGEPEYLPIGTEAPAIGNGKAIALINNSVDASEQNYYMSSNSNLQLGFNTASGYETPVGLNTSGETGIITDLTQVVGATLNALRLITASQHIKEQLLWYGSRFEEIIQSQWGVSMDATSFRIPEFLGSIRIDINMDTVLQTSSTDAESPQGNAAGYSVTLDEGHLFEKSFKTWQIITVVVVVRQDHSYAQGIANQHTKKRKYDFFWEEFAGLGAQPRLMREICVNGNENDDKTWNFAPAWREYDSEVDRACGLMQPGVNNTLANYTYTDEYTSIPNSGQSWIEETPAYVDRTLVVPSTTTDQLMMDFVFDIHKTTIKPNFRLPGLSYL